MELVFSLKYYLPLGNGKSIKLSCEQAPSKFNK